MFLKTLSDQEFFLFRDLIYQIAGINMSPAKKALIGGRLSKRLKHFGMETFGEYYQMVCDVKEELQTAVDLLTTNETYFFREEKHFDFLQNHILPQWTGDRHRRIWSAAASSGEEAYTLGMVLSAHAPQLSWEVVGTDLSRRMVEKAKRALYPLERAHKIPPPYLRQYCLKGQGPQVGRFLIAKELREAVRFHHGNLKEDLSHLGGFDLIVLRNVLIYFDLKTKQAVVERLIEQLKPQGYFFVGHAETLGGVTNRLKQVLPSIYQKL